MALSGRATGWLVSYWYSVEMHCAWRPRLQMNWSTGGSTTTGEEWKMSPSMRGRFTVTEVVPGTSFKTLYPRT